MAVRALTCGAALAALLSGCYIGGPYARRPRVVVPPPVAVAPPRALVVPPRVVVSPPRVVVAPPVVVAPFARRRHHPWRERDCDRRD